MRRRYFAEGPNTEFIERETQLPADLSDGSGALAETKARELPGTRWGEPPLAFDVRCVYDSRPANGYDFNLTMTLTPDEAAASITGQIIVPSGYRIVPREWRVNFVVIPDVTLTQISVQIQRNDADLPNNSFFIGTGTTFPIKTFFVVEENATFGLRLLDPGILLLAANVAIVQVYGNLLPVTGVALPFEVTNRKA